MNSINVTVQLCAEDRARLDGILEALKAQSQNEPRRFESVGEMAAAAKAAYEPSADDRPQAAQEAPTTAAEEKPTENPPEAEKPAEPAPAPAEEPPVPTKDELRALVQALIASGYRDQARAIVMQYGSNVSAVPEGDRAECIEKLLALKEGKA